MAADKRKARRKYDTPGAVSGNLARKLDSQELERRLERSGELDFDRQYRPQRATRADVIAQRRAKAKARIRPAQKLSPMAVLGMASVAVLMVGVLLCYVKLNTISRNIVEMKTQIATLEADRVALLTQYEQTFDKASMKEAAEAIGMTMPSDSQISYIDLPGADHAVSYSAENTNAFSRFFTSLRRGIDTVVEYFR